MDPVRIFITGLSSGAALAQISVWHGGQDTMVDSANAGSIGGMGHGTSIGAGGKDGLGDEGEYMLEVGISSTRHIVRFWSLAP